VPNSPHCPAKNYSSWERSLKDFLYRTQAAKLWKCSDLKVFSEVGQSEEAFREELRHPLREKRDLALEKLRTKYSSKLATLQDRIRRDQQRVEREAAQYKRSAFDSAISIGSSILGAMFGRKLASRTNVSRASTSARSVGRATQQRGDIARAKETLEADKKKLKELEEEFEAEIKELEDSMQLENLELHRLEISPRKSDIMIQPLQLAWTPWRVDAAGIAESLY